MPFSTPSERPSSPWMSSPQCELLCILRQWLCRLPSLLPPPVQVSEDAGVPDKTKAALLQFLGAVAPYCSEVRSGAVRFVFAYSHRWFLFQYFNQPSLASAFLTRMAALLADPSDGQPGSRPPATLSMAGKRLLVCAPAL